MSIIQDYLQTLSGDEKAVIAHMYDIARGLIPNVTEKLSYKLPTLASGDKSVIAIVKNKHFMSIYPFSGNVIPAVGPELDSYECTNGSIHFTVDHPISDDLLRLIVATKLAELS